MMSRQAWLVASLLTGLGGCRAVEPVNADPAKLSGVVTAIRRDGAGLQVLLANLHSPAGESVYHSQVIVPVQANVVFVERPDGSLQPGGFDDIRVGRSLLVWHDGPATKTDPPQLLTVRRVASPR